MADPSRPLIDTGGSPSITADAPSGTPNEVVTLVIHHKVRACDQPRYETWLRRTVKAARGQPGHLGVNVIRPSGDGQVYTSVLRFANTQLLQAWIDSEQRRTLIAEVLPLLEEGDHPVVHGDAEFWFTPARTAGGQPPKWKQAVLSYGVILPLSIIVPWLWRPVFERYPALGGMLPSNMLITACIVASVVFVIMPWATRWLARWLSTN